MAFLCRAGEGRRGEEEDQARAEKNSDHHAAPDGARKIPLDRSKTALLLSTTTGRRFFIFFPVLLVSTMMMMSGAKATATMMGRLGVGGGGGGGRRGVGLLTALQVAVLPHLMTTTTHAFLPTTTTTTTSSSSSLTLGRVLSSRGMATRRSAAATAVADKGPPPMDMFCFQCEQTRHVKGCVREDHRSVGVCGKTAETAALQDLLVHYMMGVSQYAHQARVIGGLSDPEIDLFLLQGLFSTMTNVNFDTDRFVGYLHRAQELKGRAQALYEKALSSSSGGSGKAAMSGPAEMDLSALLRNEQQQGAAEGLEAVGRMVGVEARRASVSSEDVWSLGELVLYGLKGMAAYADHAHTLGQQDEQVMAFVHEAMSVLADLPNQSVESLLQLALRTGEANFKVMALLDAGSTTRYGHPTPTQVRMSPVKGKCIAVSGHDLKDLEEVLKRTQGKGINVYTHGELLPAHGYPGLHDKYPHLVGNYGGGWQLQKIEFARFPGPIIVTTNCLIEPQKSYRDRIYTRGVVGWHNTPHLNSWDDFDKVVDQALSMKGFEADVEPAKFTTTGFGRNAVLGIADKVVSAVQSGDIKDFYLIGGCDGAEANRTYFRDIALGLPRDSVVLTLGCGKYRFNREPFETTLGGLPRLLDVGQCNDAYSAIQIALALANAFKTDVNSLPLNYVISWFEQKAVAVFLTMLHLGLKNIRLGPQLPAFVSPNVLAVLVKEYGVQPVDLEDHDRDLQKMLALARPPAQK